MRNHPPTDAELREHYAQTTLSAAGVSFDAAQRDPLIRLTLTGAIKAHRRHAARAAQHVAIQFHTPEKEPA